MAKFSIQKSSSTVNWTGKKVLGLHTGTIHVSHGHLELSDQKILGGEVVIDMTSIMITDIDDFKTNQNFKDHLFHDDFFSVDHYPTAKLTVTGGAPLNDSRYSIEGVLTIKDIAQPVSFTAKVEVFADTLHSLGEIVIDRTLYNIRYGSGKFISNLGDTLIYDDFVLQFKLIGQREN